MTEIKDEFSYCFGCSRKSERKKLKKTGTYEYENKIYDIVVCQYCIANDTKRKKKAGR